MLTASKFEEYMDGVEYVHELWLSGFVTECYELWYLWWLKDEVIIEASIHHIFHRTTIYSIVLSYMLHIQIMDVQQTSKEARQMSWTMASGSTLLFSLGLHIYDHPQLSLSYYW